MSAVIPDVAKEEFANILDGVSASWVIDLYQNNYDPVHGTVYGDFTICTFTGYIQHALTVPTVALALDGSGRWLISWASITWTKSGATGNNVYGYLVQHSSGILLWAEKAAAAPIAMSTDGDQITIVPKLAISSEFNNT